MVVLLMMWVLVSWLLGRWGEILVVSFLFRRRASLRPTPFLAVVLQGALALRGRLHL